MESEIRPVAWRWPASFDALEVEQARLARAAREQATWLPGVHTPRLGACAICFLISGESDGRGDRGFAAAVVETEADLAAVVVSVPAAAPFRRGLMALREGPPLESAVRALVAMPEVLLVNATARDHPRRAGLALHLGAVLDVPTIGVTQNTLLAKGPTPAATRGATSALAIEDADGVDVVAHALRTQADALPIIVHPGWRMDSDTALRLVLAATGDSRLPDILRDARRLARESRIASTGRP